GKYRGQRMKWFAMRFTGTDLEFDISRINNVSPEFDEWRWADVEELPEIVVPFKRDVYEAVITEFAPILAQKSL
ncbi:MAG: RNA pyrophosphohydrolase, partial [Chitinophagales bacterium]|nr:RNA pyrophosphohydrolase [Hyphomicrobiales bacterium]